MAILTTLYEGTRTEGDKKANFVIFAGLCKGCGLCIDKCPKQALSWSDSLGVYGTPMPKWDKEKCIACGLCQMVCPDCAITIEKK